MVDQSAIDHSLKKAARWRRSWRLLWIIPAALGSLVLGLQQSGEWQPPSWMVWTSVFSGATLIAAEALIGIFREPTSGGVLESGDRQKFMSSAAVEIHQQTGIAVASLGVSLWVIFTPRRSLWATLRGVSKVHYLHRVERFRASEPDATGDAWPLDRGVIGACVTANDKKYRDYRPLQQQHPAGSSPPSNTAWKAICKAERDDGFSRDEFVRMINRYEQVFAYPIPDKNGHVIGCISVDVTAAPAGSTHPALHAPSVVATVHRLAGYLRPTAEILAVRP